MPSRISDDVIDQIRQRTDIVDLIHSYVPLKRAGANFRALCPFHKEKTPSFNVHPQKQIFHCFGCGVGGDVFRFVMLRENINFMESVRLLARRAGVEIEIRHAADDVAATKKTLLYQLHEEVCAIYQKILSTDPRGKAARDYLERRKVGAEAIRQFRLGFAPDAWDNVLKWGEGKGLTVDDLETAGLITRGDKKSPYDRFRGRLMFPICDEQGRVVAFSGRTLDPEAKEAKYVNSPETPIFKKGQVLYGLHLTKNALRDAHKAIVCEGQLDLIACFSSGLTNVVASQGTAFTEYHGRTLKRHVDEVVLMFDSDAAGQDAATRSVDALLEAGLSIRVALLPQGHDPDSLARDKGAEAVQNVVNASQSFFDFYLDYLCQRNDARTDTGRAEITRRMAEMLAKTPNPALTYPYVVRTAQRLSLPDSIVHSEVNKRLRNAPPVSEETAGVESYLSSAHTVTTADRELLHLMLADKSQVSIVAENLRLEDLPQGPCKTVILKILSLERSGQWRGPESLQAELADEETSSWLSGLLIAEPRHKDFAEATMALIQSLHQDSVNAEREFIQKRLADKNLPPEEAADLLRRMQELREKPFDLRSQHKHITRLSAP